jgi:hypothetical protein
MDWNMLAAVAQVVAALGVIVSLAYLSIQLRRENQALAVEAKLNSTKLLSDFIDRLITDPELMVLWLKGRQGLEALSESDRYRFQNLCLKAFWFSSAAHFQKRMRTLSDDDWIEMYSVTRFWLEGEGVRTWWQKTGRTRFGKSFVDFVDREMASISTAELEADGRDATLIMPPRV